MFIIFIGLEKLRLPGPYRPGKEDNPFWGNWSISVTFGYVKGFRPALARLDRALCCFCDTSGIKGMELNPCKPGLGQGYEARIVFRKSVISRPAY